jgi:glucosylceramidase
MLQGGRLLNEYYDSWALYYTKFIKEYEKEGMPIWGITIQNEPMATQRWESCIYTAEEERDFLKNHLGPTMERAGLGDKKIVVWDHNRDLLANRSNTILEDPEAAKYVWGVGFHWYEVWTGSLPNYDNLKNMKESYPDKNLLFTEGCVEGFRADRYQYWPNAERYGTSMINDFNNGTSGWTDWNILLNENGGPNHVQNYCFAPVHADTKTGELIYTPSYYYIGHFSKFIRPNAKRVSTSVSRTQLQSTSFMNENGEVVTVVMNQTNEKINYRLYVGRDAVTETILPHAIQTFIY